MVSNLAFGIGAHGSNNLRVALKVYQVCPDISCFSVNHENWFKALGEWGELRPVAEMQKVIVPESKIKQLFIEVNQSFT